MNELRINTFYLCTFGVRPPDVLVRAAAELPDMGSKLKSANIVNRDTQLEPKVYVLPEGITIDSDNVTLDGQGATIMGTDKTASQGKKFWIEKTSS